MKLKSKARSSPGASEGQRKDQGQHIADAKVKLQIKLKIMIYVKTLVKVSQCQGSSAFPKIFQ